MLEAVQTDPPLLKQMSALATLRLLTCGSVDDGKSTLIGRLLYEQSLILDDQLAALERDSRRHGTDGDNIDFALLVDGLEAEREQGITIDVAYRYVSTPRRSFIIADTPGHEQYTRNMATGASGADLAILLVDARKGLLTQTCRHATIVSLTGIRHVVLAVNKIDLTGFDREGFEKIVAAFKSFAGALDFKTIMPIPVSARHGDNISAKSANTPWYSGPALLDYLEAIDVAEDERWAAVPLCRPMGQSAASRFPGIFWTDCERNHPSGRRNYCRRFRAFVADRAYRHGGWRSYERHGRRFRHSDARR